MSYGRKYIIRHRLRNRVNRFTYEDYESVCSDISWANPATNKKHVIVKHARNKMAGVVNVITEVLKSNGVHVKGYQKYASTNVKTLFKLESRDDANKAIEIINKMAMPDSIDPEKVMTDGKVTSRNGVKLVVDVKRDPEGHVVAVGGGSYVSSSNPKQDVAQSSSSSYKWLIIGGIAVVAVLAIVLILKKKKK